MRKRSSFTVGCIAAVLAVPCVPVWAQDLAVNEQANQWYQARSELNSISFDIESEEVGDGAATTKFRGSCTMMRAEAGGWRFHLAGELVTPEDTRRVLIAYDGVGARSVRDSDKTVIERTLSNMDELKSFLSGQGVAQAMVWELMDETRENGVTVDPVASTIEGEACDVMRFPATPNEAADAIVKSAGTVMHIAREDRLPRLIERSRTQTSSTGEVTLRRVLKLTRVKRGEAAEGRPFVIDAPDGYRVRADKPARKITPQRKERPERTKDELIAKGDAAPEWTLKDAAGVEVSLSGLKGQVVVLDFWATWCGPCKIAMPHVQKLHEDYADKGVKVFGVNCWERADARAYMTKSKYTYGLLLDGDKVADMYHVSGIPTFYVIDQEGKVAFAATGMPKEAALRETIDALLAK